MFIYCVLCSISLASTEIPLVGVEPIKFQLKPKVEVVQEKEDKVKPLSLPTVQEPCKPTLEGSWELLGQCDKSVGAGRTRGVGLVTIRVAF